MHQVIDVHGRLDGHSVRGLAHFQNLPGLFVSKTRKARKRRGEFSPVYDWVHGLDPNGSALESAGAIQLKIGIARRVTFRAFGHLFDQISSAVDLVLVGFRGALRPGAGDAGPAKYEHERNKDATYRTHSRSPHEPGHNPIPPVASLGWGMKPFNQVIPL
jgi:hypothetical protein